MLSSENGTSFNLFSYNFRFHPTYHLRPYFLSSQSVMLVVTQIRYHKVRLFSSPPFPTTILALEGIFIARRRRPFLLFSLAESHRIEWHTPGTKHRFIYRRLQILLIVVGDRLIKRFQVGRDITSLAAVTFIS